MLRSFFILLLLTLFSLSVPTLANADTIKMKNGQVYKGVITAEEDERVQLKMDGTGARIWFSRDQILSFEKEDPTEDSRLAAEEPTRPVGPVDCGTDIDCFIEAAENCDMAKVLYTSTLDQGPLGIISTTTVLLEIKGRRKDNKCIFRQRFESLDIKFNDEMVQRMLDSGLTQEEINQQEQTAREQAQQATVGVQQTCKYNQENLTNMLNEWKTGTFAATFSGSIGDYDGAECTVQEPDSGIKCTLQGAQGSIKLRVGFTSHETVSGFRGDPSEVSWISEDPNIVTVDPVTGSSTKWTTKNVGSTRVIATDNAVGPNCKNYMSIEVMDSSWTPSFE